MKTSATKTRTTTGRTKCALAAALLTGAGAMAAVTIDTVPVGNTGNSDDTHGDGYGAVDYEYNIGTYEVTAGQYTEFLNAVADTDSYGLYNTNMDSDMSPYACNIKRSGQAGSHSYSVAGDWADRPVNYVSWGDAARFANWLHNGQPTGAQDATTTEDGAYFLNGATSDAALMAVDREDDWLWAIPTEDEWYKAAYHYNDGNTDSYYDYPTSSDSPPSNDLTEPDDGNNATYLDVSYTIGFPYYRTEAGAHEDSGSPYGTFDQGGNVHEWNETQVSGNRGVRGGSVIYSVDFLRANNRGSNDPTREFYYFGFRVASRVPEPGSIALLILGGAGIVARRRRVAA